MSNEERVHSGRIIWNGEIYDVYSPERVPNYTAGWISGFGSIGFENASGGELKRGKLKKVECKEVMKSYTLEENICGIFDSGGNIPALYYSTGGYYNRKAFLEKPVKINGKLYIVEIKGVGSKGEKIKLNELRTISPFLFSFPTGDTGPIGGLTLEEGSYSAKVTKELNESGIDMPFFIALYELPLTYRNLYGEEKALAIEVRGTDSTMRASWFDPHSFNKHFFLLLNVDSQEYVRSFLKKTLSAYRSLLELGYIHMCPHEDNMLITGGLTDLGDTKSLARSNKNDVKVSFNYFIFSLYKVVMNLQPIDEKLEEEDHKIFAHYLFNNWLSSRWNEYWNLIGRRYKEYEKERMQNAFEMLNEGINEEFGFNPKFENFNEEKIHQTAEKIVESCYKSVV
jgi:hypothetical protein